jgi:hypothetical protein
VASRAKRIDTRRNVRISDRFIRVGEQGLRQNNRAENSHQPASAVVVQETALQIAWISLTLSLTERLESEETTGV